MSVVIRKGNVVQFRALTGDDINNGWYDWFNDPEITKYMSRGAFPNTPASQKAFLDNFVSNSERDVVFAVEFIKDNAFIGVAAVRNISWLHRTGEVSAVLGNKKYHGKGAGYEAFKLVTDHSFEALNLNRLMAMVDPDNTPSLKCLKRIGFKEYGVGRKVFYKNGDYRNGVYLDLLREEWETAKK